MTHAPLHIAVPLEKVLKLEELAIEVCNCDASTARYLTLILNGPPSAWVECLATAQELAKKGRKAMMSLMWEIRQIRLSSRQQGFVQPSISLQEKR